MPSDIIEVIVNLKSAQFKQPPFFFYHFYLRCFFVVSLCTNRNNRFDFKEKWKMCWVKKAKVKQNNTNALFQCFWSSTLWMWSVWDVVLNTLLISKSVDALKPSLVLWNTPCFNATSYRPQLNNASDCWRWRLAAVFQQPADSLKPSVADTSGAALHDMSFRTM